MPTPDRFEAIGPRGEACVILRHATLQSNGARTATYTLATGERLRQAEDAPDEFDTLDGKRRFKLRQAATLGG